MRLGASRAGIGPGLGLRARPPSTPAYDPAKLLTSLGSLDSVLSPLTLSGANITAAQTIGNVVTTMAPRGGTNPATLDTTTLIGGARTIQLAAGQTLVALTGGAPGLVAHTVAAVVRVDVATGLTAFACTGQAGAAQAVDVLGVNSLTLWAGSNPSTSPSGLPDAFAAGVDTTGPHVYRKTVDGAGNVRAYIDGYLACSGSLSSLNLAAGFGLDSYAGTAQTPCHVRLGDWRTGADTLAQGDASDRYGAALASITYPRQVVCVGDSFALSAHASTPGVKGNVGNGSGPTLEDVLYQQMLSGGLATTVWNVGYSGAPVATIQGTQLADVAGHRTGIAPRNVGVIWIGVNDIMQAIQAQATANPSWVAAQLGVGAAAAAFAALTTYCSTLTSLGFDAWAVLTYPPNEFFTKGTQTYLASVREMATYNALLVAQAGSALGATCIDVGSLAALQNPEDGVHFYSDNFHPIDAGYAVIGAAVAAVVARL